MIIKAVLIGCVVIAGWWLLTGGQRGRQLAIRRLLTIALCAAAVAAVVAPDAVTRVANAIGVGRGTDLVLYVLVIVFAFSTIAASVRTRRLEDRLTRLTRAVALLEPDAEQFPTNTR